MKIDPDKCLGCGTCVDYCPMACIQEGDGAYCIDQDECVECGVCLRAQVCPVEAIYLPESSKEYPRYLRAAFSDPGVQFPETFQGGRGTEEMKTNDVTGKFRRGQFGMTLEFGRPGTGARFKEVEKVTRVLGDLDVHLEEANPLYFLMEDKKTGRMKPEVREEKVLSCILEFGFRDDQLEEVVQGGQNGLVRSGNRGLVGSGDAIRSGRKPALPRTAGKNRRHGAPQRQNQYGSRTAPDRQLGETT